MADASSLLNRGCLLDRSEEIVIKIVFKALVQEKVEVSKWM